ncbi:MAG: hypothetical protein ACO3GT_02460, partial [Candidatus Nanopelagicales bacterium]
MLRELLVSASRSEKLEHLVSTSPLSRGVVNRFVAGTTTADVVSTVQNLHDLGLLATVDRLGEDTLDRAAEDTTVADYKDLLRALSAAGLSDSAEVSVKTPPRASASRAVDHAQPLSARAYRRRATPRSRRRREKHRERNAKVPRGRV